MTVIGFEDDEIDISAPTRAARLKWVVIVDAELDPGRAANAVACVAAATGHEVRGLLGPSAVDAEGGEHAGLPWAGCSLLAATAEQLSAISRRARASGQEHVADMPEAAQATRVYQEYLERMTELGEPRLLAVSVVGPRNRVDKLTKGLQLL